MSNYCCFLPIDRTTPIREMRELGKTFQGVFIGIGYIFPHDQKGKLQTICDQSHIPLLILPMGTLDFTSYVDSYKLDFLHTLKNEKDLKLKLLMTKTGMDPQAELFNDPKLNELKEEIEDLEMAIQKRQKAQLLRDATDQISPYESLLIAPTEKELAEEIQKISPGISTSYQIDRSDLKLEGGEISVIAAPTGHGKTSFIINILLGILEENENSNVYLFSYEEARAPLICLALNSYIGETISMNNRESIKSYFREGNVQYVIENMKERFLQKKNDFFSDLIQSRRLNIFYTSFTAEELTSAIRFLAKQERKPTAICIDYMQLLRLSVTGKNSSRQEELKQICLLLKDCAVETGLPILIAAQFNRTVQNERELLAQAIGEAGDIERIAALILGLWNRKFNQDKPEDTIYVKVLKGRHIPMGTDETLDFDGNACRVANRHRVSLDKPLNDLF